MSQAISCLDVQPIDNDYTLALLAYAYALSDPSGPVTAFLYRTLKDNAITGQYITNLAEFTAILSLNRAMIYRWENYSLESNS